MSIRFQVIAVTIAGALAAPAWAENRALILGNENFMGAESVPGASEMAPVVEALEAAGYRVRLEQDLTGVELRAALDESMLQGGTDRLIILLAGHFAHGGGANWFLGVDADAPTATNADGVGLSLWSTLWVLSNHPGGAILLVGIDSEAELPLGSGLQPGRGRLNVPQGVAVISGDIADILEFSATELPATDVSVPAMLEDWPMLRAEGYLSRLHPFLPFVDPEDLPEPEVDEEALAAEVEREVWEAALSTDTVAAFEAYLASYPEGMFADEARDAIARLTEVVAEEPVDEVPVADPAQIEAALGLTAAQRRQIQQQLTDLGFNPRGVDGVFGPGTRAAITAWQDGRGLPATGFLTAEQRVMLTEDAARRQAEIAEQERLDRLAAEQADRNFWRDTGQGQDETGIRNYLDRYPNGLFAGIARARLAEFVAQRDRSAWNTAETTDTVAAYRRYLQDFPQGQFAANAQARLDALLAADREALDRAAWNTAQAADTVAAYRRYLDEFPNGLFAANARSRLDALLAADAGVRDRDAWNRAQAADTVAAYRAYLDEFPNGLFAANARSRLDMLLTADAELRDRDAWERARLADTVAAYRAYLDEFPNGAFAEQARARIAQLEPAPPPVNEVARAEEQALNLNPLTIGLIKAQLTRLGFNPGSIGPQIDESTRAAIRDYQASRGLDVNGYVDRRTLARLIGEGLPL